MITQEKAIEIFEYRDGVLYWKENRSRKKLKGKPVGTSNEQGYIRTTVDHKPYKVHRLIFLMHHGFMPESVDHIDGNPANNRIENLRPATRSQNSMNAKTRSDNSSGVKGVSWYKRLGKWQVYVVANKRHVTVGYFDCRDEAEAASVKARLKLHGEFARV